MLEFTRWIVLLLLLTIITLSLQAKDSVYVIPPAQSNVDVNAYDTVIHLDHSRVSPFTTNPQILILKDKGSSEHLKYILPILTLILGIFINQFIDWRKDRKDLKKYGERWVAEFRGLEEPLTKQIDALKSLLVEEQKFDYDMSSPQVYITLNCETFKSLDKLKFTQYIEQKSSGNSIRVSNHVYGLIGVLTSLYTTLFQAFEDYKNQRSKYTLEVSQQLQTLTQAFAQYSVILEKEMQQEPDILDGPRHKPLLDLFEKNITPHLHDGKYDLFKLQESFFAPLLHHLGMLRHDAYTKEMVTHLTKCLTAIRGIKMEKTYWIENLSTIIHRYEEQKEALTSTIKEIGTKTLSD